MNVLVCRFVLLLLNMLVLLDCFCVFSLYRWMFVLSNGMW